MQVSILQKQVVPMLSSSIVVYVVPEDVRAVAHDVLRHRIGLSYEAEATDLTTEKIISEIINKVQVP